MNQDAIRTPKAKSTPREKLQDRLVLDGRGVLDVSNLWRPVIVGEVEDEVLSVLSGTRDMK